LTLGCCEIDFFPRGEIDEKKSWNTKVVQKEFSIKRVVPLFNHVIKNTVECSLLTKTGTFFQSLD
jgi:hypothetical protein